LDAEGIYLFQPPHPAPIAHLPMKATATVQFQPDGRALLTGGTNGVLRWPMQWSADRSELRLGPPAILEPTRGQRVTFFDMSGDGQWMVAATTRASLGFDPERSSEAIRADAQIEPETRPHLSSDGHLAASHASSFKSACVQIWNPRTGMLLTNLPARPGYNDVAFSPDGRWLACAAEDATTFWRTEDWSPQHRLSQAAKAPGRRRVAFSPDGRIAALSVSDREIRMMKVETGEEFATLPTARLLTWLAFSPGGDRLAAACEPGYFQLWNLRQLRKELAAMNLDWAGVPFPPDRSDIGKSRITAVLESSRP
jgi:WD40 repeat protein